MATSSPVGLTSTGPQVFINFRGTDMHNSFIGFLVTALRNANINVFTDRDEVMGTSLQNLLVRIEESKLAIAIFSENYTGSVWCLDELVKIKECMDQGSLIAIPIFYKIEPSMVKHLEGKFGDVFRTLKRMNRHEQEKTQKWEEALTSIPQILGGRLSEKSDFSDEDFIKRIVEGVQRSLTSISIRENPSTELNLEGLKIGNQTRDTVLDEPKKDPKLQELSLEGLNLQENQSIRDTVLDEPKKDPTLPEVYRSEHGFTARQLEIVHSENRKKWAWSFICDASTNKHNIEVAMVKKVHWLEIKGMVNTANLRAGVEYEVMFVVRLKENASGWKRPVMLELKVCDEDGSKIRQEGCQVNLMSYIDQGWVNIQAGAFVAPAVDEDAVNVYFTLYQIDFKMKGLVVQGVAINPSHTLKHIGTQ